jgi:hypothetical protein
MSGYEFFQFGADSFGYPAGSIEAQMAAMGVRPPAGSIAAPAGRMAFSPGVLGPRSSSMALTPGSLGIGRSGLGGLAGQIGGAGRLPYTNPLGSLLQGAAGPGGLPRLGTTGSQVLGDVANLRPLQSPLSAMGADRGLANQLGAASRAGGTRGMLPRLPSLGLKSPGMLKGGVYGVLGGVGANLADQLNIGGNDSVLDQFATGAAFGGISGGAFGGVGALVGAPVGGAVNVLGNALGLWGNDTPEADKPEPIEVLATAIQTANLSPDEEEAILQTYETNMALAEQYEGDQREQAEQLALDQAGQLVLVAMQRRQQQAQQAQGGGMGGPDMLALQQQAADIFEPIAQDIETNAGLYAQAMQGIRPNLPASYQSVSDAQVARELSSADKLANAYRAQAALTPVVNSLTQYQQDQNAFASQLFQQMQAQQAAAMAQGGLGMGGVGVGGAGDLLAQLQPQ